MCDEGSDGIAEIAELMFFVVAGQFFLQHLFDSLVFFLGLVVDWGGWLHEVSHLSDYLLLELVEFLLGEGEVLLELDSLLARGLVAGAVHGGLDVAVF